MRPVHQPLAVHRDELDDARPVELLALALPVRCGEGDLCELVGEAVLHPLRPGGEAERSYARPPRAPGLGVGQGGGAGDDLTVEAHHLVKAAGVERLVQRKEHDQEAFGGKDFGRRRGQVRIDGFQGYYGRHLVGRAGDFVREQVRR